MSKTTSGGSSSVKIDPDMSTKGWNWGYYHL